MSLTFQTQVVSLVTDGVFVKYPVTRIVLIEGGFVWLAPLMWRLDKNYRSLRSEIPWLTELPSKYIRDHFRATTQPMEEPSTSQHLLSIFEMIGCDDFLMFSTNYPHWNFDAPDQALPANLSDDLRKRIMATNALDFYNFTRD